jgi:hypothetical protein
MAFGHYIRHIRRQREGRDMTLLEEADAATMRLIDLFKRKTIWRQLVIADGKGRYRLNIEFLAPERRKVRFYRMFKPRSTPQLRLPALGG